MEISNEKAHIYVKKLGNIFPITLLIKCIKKVILSFVRKTEIINNPEINFWHKVNEVYHCAKTKETLNKEFVM